MDIPYVIPKPAGSPSQTPCQWIVDLEKEDQCGERPTSKIKVDSRIQEAFIYLCTRHKAENHQKYAARRTSNKSQ